MVSHGRSSRFYYYFDFLFSDECVYSEINTHHPNRPIEYAYGALLHDNKTRLCMFPMRFEYLESTADLLTAVENLSYTKKYPQDVQVRHDT